MPTKTEAIKTFLGNVTHADLAELYSYEMECQVNVAQDWGNRTEGDFKGRKWHGYTDGEQTWKSFRIPLKANSEPEYVDREIIFDLELHAEGIGLTGWDWCNRVSKWVGYDFDAITGHSENHEAKLTDTELNEIKEAVQGIDWVTVRKSTSGKGLHLYVFTPDVPTTNHTEHAALARAILGKISALAGFDFDARVDAMGGNLWVWHRKMKGSDGLSLIKSGSVIPDHEIPPNWRDHINVTKGSRKKPIPQNIEGLDKSGQNEFEQLCNQKPFVPLDETHKKIINYLKENDWVWWFDQSLNCLVTHTKGLENAHNDLGLRGFFKTNSPGNDPTTQNCFSNLLRDGAFVVRRFSKGVQEHKSWTVDSSGWTKAYLNKDLDLYSACRIYDGVEDTDGGFLFKDPEDAKNAAKLLGVDLEIVATDRKVKLKEHKDGRIIATVDKQKGDSEFPGWLTKKNEFQKIYHAPKNSPPESEIGEYDNLVRHLVTETTQDDYGWVIYSDGAWRTEPLTHVRSVLGTMGLTPKELNNVIGNAVLKPWTVVNKPFQPEYPGNRQWNRNAAQMRFTPTRDVENLKFDTWLSILNHCGDSLTEAVKEDPWCKENGILTGGDYLKCWVASIFQSPLQPLPYLFFYGPQNSGKSIFHESLSLLLTKGYQRADAALMSGQGFNSELENAIVCVIEETDLKKNKTAYNRIKDWATCRELLIHPKGHTPYHVPNSLHFIQTSNEHTACPLFPGDTRVTMSYVPALEQVIPKKEFIDQLEREAPDFLAEISTLEIPPSRDRLMIPVLNTSDKETVQSSNKSELEVFIEQYCEQVNGKRIKYSDFFEKFQEWLENSSVGYWSRVRVGKELPPSIPKGRDTKTGHFYLGNLTWKDDEDKKVEEKWILREGFLKQG